MIIRVHLEGTAIMFLVPDYIQEGIGQLLMVCPDEDFFCLPVSVVLGEVG
jgi:hypothetical protein